MTTRHQNIRVAYECALAVAEMLRRELEPDTPAPDLPDPNANALQRLMDQERQSTIAYGARVSVPRGCP